MRDFRDAKLMAKSLRQGLSQREIEIGHSEALELIAKAFGYDNWNILAAKIEAAAATSAAPPDGTRYCSFCGKSQHEVETLIAGPRQAAICNECVVLGVNVLEEPEIGRCIDADLTEPDAQEAWPRLMAFMRAKPDHQLRAYLESGEKYLPRFRNDVEEARRKPLMPQSLPVAERRVVIIEHAMKAAGRVLAEREG